MSGYFDLGSYSRPVTASSAEARTWVVRGLLWAYGFNHEEAVACFEQAAAADPDCALAYWGLAYALGPNYNKPWDAFEPGEARSAVARARAAVADAQRLALAPGVSGAERALIGALAYRYPAGSPAADPAGPPAAGAVTAGAVTAGAVTAGAVTAGAVTVGWAVWNRDYADAMRAAYAAQADDLDVAVLFADALMNLTPWELWDTATGQPAAGAATVEARAVLERALATPAGRAHPGALHLYIHLMEMSPRPEEALWAGDLLRDLVPDAGHLLHMPAHLDVLCGDYRQVVVSNEAAIRADQRYLAARGEMNFYTLYRVHNYHFKIYGAMFAGQSAVALETAGALADAIPESLLRVQVPPMTDWLEGFVPVRVHVLIRFGRWQELIDAPLPSDPDLYCVTTAMLHYGKGIGYAATGRLAAVLAQQALFAAAADRVPESRTIFNNTCRDILAVAAAMLDGELAYREGRVEEAFARLRRAIELDDGLPYDEPWGWMQPARHAYGALLLEQGRLTEAEAVYRADLGLDGTLPRPGQHPGNLWSLHGYHECLTRQAKHEQAGIIAQQLTVAAARADVPVTASCYCRLSAVTSASGAGHAEHPACH